METYAKNLEDVVHERTVQLAGEKKRLENLLLRMLPPSAAGQILRGSQVIPDAFDCVTVYFSDIVDFTSLAARLTPLQVEIALMIEILNCLIGFFILMIAMDLYQQNFRKFLAKMAGIALQFRSHCVCA